jgi:hypothetical protein
MTIAAAKHGMPEAVRAQTTSVEARQRAESVQGRRVIMSEPLSGSSQHALHVRSHHGGLDRGDLPLLGQVLEAHGGLDRWRALKTLSSTLVTGGQLWRLKGHELGEAERVVTTDLRRQWASMAPFGEPGWTMTWTPERVVVEDASGTLIAERDAPRTAFGGHRYDTPWDPLHLAYFNGYAMWTYHAAPFIFAEPGYEVTEIAPIVHEGVTMSGLAVSFPEGVHTHTREQRFYFGPDKLLRRHDYEVDVWAGTPAAHLLYDYTDVQGFRLPGRRSVFLRKPDGAIDYGLNMVTVAMSNYVPR